MFRVFHSFHTGLFGIHLFCYISRVQRCPITSLVKEVFYGRQKSRFFANFFPEVLLSPQSVDRSDRVFDIGPTGYGII